LPIIFISANDENNKFYFFPNRSHTL
jgi:hypothetical protein